jgi:hypothetical protein
MAVPNDPVLLGILAVLGALFFLGFLLLRRTVIAFREGFDQE